jgi:GST-like protein
MLTLYSALSPAVYKVMIALEEMGLDYTEVAINPLAGEQHDPDFLKLGPNAKVPVLVDSEPGDEAGPLAIFESGAILIYLAEKTGGFLPDEVRARACVLQWVMWQMAGLGPAMGNARHFRHLAPEPYEYAIRRFTREAGRLCSVLNGALRDREYLCGAYSIADICCWPWLLYAESNGHKLADYPDLSRWYDVIKSRPAVQRVGARTWETFDFESPPPLDAQTRKILFERRS